MTIEKRAILTDDMKRMKSKGYKYVVTYNNTEKFLTFKDLFYKTKEAAVKKYESLTCGMKKIQEL